MKKWLLASPFHVQPILPIIRNSILVLFGTDSKDHCEILRLPVPRLSILPWLAMDTLQSELAVAVKTDIHKCSLYMLASWGTHSEIVESSLRKPWKYFELIYHTAKTLWGKMTESFVCWLLLKCRPVMNYPCNDSSLWWASIMWGNLFFFNVKQCYGFTQLQTFIWNSFLCNYLCGHP